MPGQNLTMWREIPPVLLVTQLGPRVPHSRNCAATAGLVGPVAVPPEPPAALEPKPEFDGAPGLGVRYAGVRSLLTAHDVRLSGRGPCAGCVLSKGHGAGCRDQACS